MKHCSFQIKKFINYTPRATLLQNSFVAKVNINIKDTINAYFCYHHMLF